MAENNLISLRLPKELQERLLAAQYQLSSPKRLINASELIRLAIEQLCSKIEKQMEKESE